jgi:hypothetical protein
MNIPKIFMRDNAFATEVRKLVKEISNDTELGAKIRILINEINENEKTYNLIKDNTEDL